MIEAFSIPVLLKAVKFLFEEGSKILQERRERRSKEHDKANTIETPTSSDEAVSKDIIQSKETALSQQIDEVIWSNSEAQIKHLMSLLEIHTRNYYLAKEQYAKWGSALVPPIIVSNLTEAEDEVVTTTKSLQSALNKVYGKKVTTQEIEQA